MKCGYFGKTLAADALASCVIRMWNTIRCLPWERISGFHQLSRFGCLIVIENKYIFIFSRMNSARKAFDMAITSIPCDISKIHPLTFALRWLSFNKPTIIPCNLCAIPRTIHLRRVAPDQMPERVILLRDPSVMSSVVKSMFVTPSKLQHSHLYRLTLKTLMLGGILPSIIAWGKGMGNQAHADKIGSDITMHIS